jgi:hypothetical protein
MLFWKISVSKTTLSAAAFAADDDDDDYDDDCDYRDYNVRVYVSVV